MHEKSGEKFSAFIFSNTVNGAVPASASASVWASASASVSVSEPVCAPVVEAEAVSVSVCVPAEEAVGAVSDDAAAEEAMVPSHRK